MTVFSMFGTTVSAATQSTANGQWVYTTISQSTAHGLPAYYDVYTYEYKVNG